MKLYIKQKVFSCGDITFRFLYHWCVGSSPTTRTISGKHFRSKSLKAYGRKCLPDFLYPQFEGCNKRSKVSVKANGGLSAAR